VSEKNVTLYISDNLSLASSFAVLYYSTP